MATTENVIILTARADVVVGPVTQASTVVLLSPRAAVVGGPIWPFTGQLGLVRSFPGNIELGVP